MWDSQNSEFPPDFKLDVGIRAGPPTRIGGIQRLVGGAPVPSSIRRRVEGQQECSQTHRVIQIEPSAALRAAMQVEAKLAQK
jgi:hypothetical protein